MAKIVRQVTVARDGLHNAFTDLACRQGCYWVSYRKGSSHVSMDGQAVVSVSADRTRFREACRLNVPGDNRDPKLVAMADGRLALHVASWIGGVEAEHIEQFIAFSQDGFTWSPPARILPVNRWLWRVGRHGGKYFGMIKCIGRSGDGTGPKHLRYLAGRGFPREQGDPTFPFPATLCLWKVRRGAVELAS